MHLRRSTLAVRLGPVVGPSATDALPDSVLELVLLALPLPDRVRSGCVSKRFLALSLRPSLYAHLSFEQLRRPRIISPELLCALVRRAGSKLRSLDTRTLPTKLRSLVSSLSAQSREVRAFDAVTLAVEALAPSALQSLQVHLEDRVFDADLLRLQAACPHLSFFSGTVWCKQAGAADGVEKLKQALRALMPAGSVLYLSSYGTLLTAERMHEFVLALGSSPMTGLRFGNMGFDDALTNALVRELIAFNVRLRRLELNFNVIGPAGADALARLITSCDSHEYLDVQEETRFLRNRSSRPLVCAQHLLRFTTLPLRKLFGGAVSTPFAFLSPNINIKPSGVPANTRLWRYHRQSNEEP